MSTTTEDIAIDIDALDAKAAEKAANAAKKPDSAAELPPVEVETAPELVPAPEKTALSTDDGIKKLQKQLDDEKAARIAAENRANEASHAEARARGEVQASQLDTIKGAIGQLTTASDALEAKYAEAAAAGDWGAAAKVQREMAGNAAKLAQLEAGKNALEKAPKPVPRAPADPVEAYVAEVAPQWPRSAQWLRSHPDFVTDKNKNQQMLAAHQLALARGHAVESDAYFASIEKTLDLGAPVVIKPDPKQDDTPDPTADAAKPVNGSGRTAAPASAPVTRGGNGGGSRPNVVKLTPAQVEMAQNMGMTAEEYARQVVVLKKEGKLQ